MGGQRLSGIPFRGQPDDDGLDRTGKRARPKG